MSQPPIPRLPPAASEYGVAGLILGLTLGYLFSQARSIGLLGRSQPRPANHHNQHKSPSTRSKSARAIVDPTSSASASASSASASDSDDSVQDLGELQSFPGNSEECKLVLVVRTDLGMTKGA
jgi:hypothetical protein